MSFLGAVTKAVQTTVKQVEQAAPQVKAAPPTPPSLPTIRDAFEQAPRPKLDLGARLDANGLNASLDVKVGRETIPLASFSVGAAGVRVSDGTTTFVATAKDGLGVSTKRFGDTLGVHVISNDPVATLGAVDVKAGGLEFELGMVPAAPAPLPVPLYIGDERK